MRGITWIAFTLWLAAQLSAPAGAADGEPDPNFGQGGYVQIDTAPAGSSVNDVIAGVAGPNGSTYAVTRLGSVKQTISRRSSHA